MIQNVAVLGATGTLGRVLVPALKEAGFNVTAVTRPSSTQTPDNPNITFKEASYDNVDTLTAAFQEQHAIIEAFNPAAATSQPIIIRAALAAGVKHVILPEFGPDTFNPQVEELLVYNPKIAARKELQNILSETGADLSWTGIITGAWYDWGIEQGLFWINKKDKSITKFGSGEQRYAISTLDRIAQAVVRVLMEPEVYRDRPAYFANHMLTTNQLIEIVKDTGGQDWKVHEVSLHGFLEQGKQLWAQDSKADVENRLATPAYAMLGTMALFDEGNRYGGDFGGKVEPGWEQGEEVLREQLRKLLL